MKISEILKSIRIEHGLTQKELSERLKIGQATIACYENGQRDPHILNLVAYADFFECSIDFLVGRADDFGNVIVDAENTKTSKTTLTKDEPELLEKYEELSPASKLKLSGFVDGLLSAEKY